MMPQFTSPELNKLLALELAEVSYPSPEDAILAGLKVLRDSRSFQAKLSERIMSLNNGRAISIDGEEALGEFFDAIDREVDVEIQSQFDSEK
jgi:hypothetical protein